MACHVDGRDGAGLRRRLTLPLVTALALLLGAGACSDKGSPGADAGSEGDAVDVSQADSDGTADAADDGAVDATGVVLPAPTTPVVFLNSGPARLEINLERRDLRLSWDGVERTVLPLDELRIGQVPKLDPERNYAPTTLAEVPVDGLTWLVPHTLAFVDHAVPTTPPPVGLTQGEGVTLAIAVTDTDGAAAAGWQLHIDALAPGTFRCRLELADTTVRAAQAADQGKPQLVYTGLSAVRGAAERFYGLGEWFDRPEHTGLVRPMQIEIDLGMESGYNEAHVPVPFVIGTWGWALFVQSRRPALFDVAHSDPDRVSALFHSAGFDFWLFAAATPLELVGRYTRVTGAPAVPAPWALGPLIWRNENSSDTEVLDDMAAIRKHDLAITGMWIDRPYDTHVNNFEFDPDRFKDAQKMVDAVRAAGFGVGLWSTPYVEEGAAAHAKVSAEGWFVGVPKVATQFLKWGAPLDLTNPAAAEFWRGQIKKMADRGVAGWKLDFGEDIHPGLFHVRAHYTFADGSDERTMHHGYPLVYHQPYVDNLPEEGGFILARAGTYGGQRLASMIWPGDLDAGFHAHGWCESGPPCDGEKRQVGGLPASLSAMLGLAASGYPVYAADTGGYRGGRPTKALFLRWMAQTAFSAAMQLGGSKQCNPWDFDTYVGKWGTSTFDDDVLDAARRYTRLHLRLNPYLFSLVWDAHGHGPGPVRPFGLAFPQHAKVPGFWELADSQYLLGDAFLVAPVLTEAGKRKVLLPDGAWYDFWTHARVPDADGLPPGSAQVVDVEVADSGIPVWLKAGAVVPMLPSDVDTLYPTSAADVVSAATDPGTLHVIVTPGPASARTLHDGTTLSQAPAGKATEVKVAPGKRYTQGWIVEAWLGDAPKVVAVDGVPAQSVPNAAAGAKCEACWWHVPAEKATHVRLAPGPHVIALLPK